MMESWKSYLFSLVVCAFICGILSQIISDGKRKELLRLISGTVLAIVLLQPLSGINLEQLLQVPFQNLNAADTYIAEGEQIASEAQERIIEDICEAYILDKAKALGANIMVEISLDHDRIPVFAEMYGAAEADVQLQLQEILTTDLGIPKENQKWIWNQESSSSSLS